MAARRDLPFPLVIVCLVFIRGYTPLPTTSEVTGTDPTELFSPSAYLSDYHDETVTTILPKRPNLGGPRQRCDYNPCLENQPACSKLQDATGCLCPGFTMYDEIPEAPELKAVSWNGSEVVVQWCAPNSKVTGYIVTVGGERNSEFRKDQRNGAVGDIDEIAEVCVFAVNDAGHGKGDCKMYQPRDNSLPLKAGLIGGALGFLLLLSLALLLWRHKRQRKQEASISMQDGAVTQ